MPQEVKPVVSYYRLWAFHQRYLNYRTNVEQGAPGHDPLAHLMFKDFEADLEFEAFCTRCLGLLSVIDRAKGECAGQIVRSLRSHQVPAGRRNRAIQEYDGYSHPNGQMNSWENAVRVYEDG